MWDEINDFKSYAEFDRFVVWIRQQVELGMARNVEVASPYVGASFKEQWFQDVSNGRIWRLVWPDAPFTGVFEPVN
jgi:hypothetical protein